MSPKDYSEKRNEERVPDDHNLVCGRREKSELQVKDERQECCPGIPRNKGFQADGIGGRDVNCCPNVQQDEDREVAIGFNSSEIFGDQHNANFSVVVGQEVTLRVRKGRPGL